MYNLPYKNTPVVLKTPELEIVDLTKYNHASAIRESKRIIDSVVGQRIIIVDLDGPILQAQGFRIGLSVGILPEAEDKFLRTLARGKSNKVLVYSSRPLWGAYAQFWNSPGGIVERLSKSLTMSSDQKETTLKRQLTKAGIPRENILYPKGIEAIFFPLYKWNEWLRLSVGKETPLLESLRSNGFGDASLVYMGDTRTDLGIFHQLVRLRTANSKARNIFIKFHSSYPGGLF